MSGGKPAVVVVGHVLREVVERGGARYGPVLGGPAAYASLAIQTCEGQARLVTHATNEDRATLLEPLAQLGVDLSGVCVSRTRTSVLRYDDRGGKSLEYGAVPPPIEARQVMGREWTGAVLLCPLDFEIDRTLPASVAKSGQTLMADLGGFGGAASTSHPLQSRQHDGLLTELLDAAPIVKVSDEDLRYISLEPDPARNAEMLVARGASACIVTCGEDGAYVKSGPGPVRHIYIPGVNAIDTTGAGDVFCGSFLVEFLRSWDEVRATRMACAFASCFVETSGGASLDRLPSRDALRSRTQRVSESVGI